MSLDSSPDPVWCGMVRAVQANFYRVYLADPGIDILCTRRSRLKKIGQQVMVGDQVSIYWDGDLQTAQGAVEAVQPRRNWLPRPAIANVDQALIVVALAEPPLEPLQLSRFLVQAEASRLMVQVCLNKADLVGLPEQRDWTERIRGWGYDPILLSAKEQIGLDALQAVCQGKISVVTGLSGVGKSTLLNQLVPALNLSTQAVSGRLRHGRHTTRHVELFPLGSEGWIADSPGFNQVDVLNSQSTGLIDCFPEVRAQARQCQFRDCLHQDEPGCRIREISWERYDFYLQFLQEILAQEQAEQAIGTPDAKVKFKAKSSGQAAVPRLSSQDQQSSRRYNRQQAQTLKGDPSVLWEQEAEAD